MDRAPLEVMIVDHELFARTRLRSLVQGCAEPRCQVAGEAADAPSALQWLRENRCDVVLLDVAMPGIDGLQLAEQLQAQHGGQQKAPAVVLAGVGQGQSPPESFWSGIGDSGRRKVLP